MHALYKNLFETEHMRFIYIYFLSHAVDVRREIFTKSIRYPQFEYTSIYTIFISIPQRYNFDPELNEPSVYLKLLQIKICSI